PQTAPPSPSTSGPTSGPVPPPPRSTSGWAIPDEVMAAARLAAGAAAAVLAVTSTGSAVVAAAALVVPVADRRSSLVVVAAVAAASLRYGSSTLDDWAGIQTVLGAGVQIGPVRGAVSAWSAAAALILAVGRVPGAAGVGGGLDRVVPAVAAGSLAAALAFGPGPQGDVWMRVVGTVVAAAVAFVVAGDRWRVLTRR